MKQDDESLYGGPLEVPGEPLGKSSTGRRKIPHFLTKKLLLILLCLVTVAGLAFGAWQLAGNFNRLAAPAESDDTQNLASADNLQTDVPDVTDTKKLKSDRPRIELAYPSSWAVSETEDAVRLESPGFTYKLANGESVAGHFRIYIRQGARAADSVYIGKGIAVQQSEKLTYANPAPGQRAETNLSHFGLDTPDAFAYFLIAGNYALQKGDFLGPDYGKETETYIIAGGYSSKELADDLATNPVPLDFYNSTKAYEQALDILRSLKLL